METTKTRSTGQGSTRKTSTSKGRLRAAGTRYVPGAGERSERSTSRDYLPVYGDEGWGESKLPSEFQAPEYESHHVILDESEYISRLSEI